MKASPITLFKIGGEGTESTPINIYWPFVLGKYENGNNPSTLSSQVKQKQLLTTV